MIVPWVDVDFLENLLLGIWHATQNVLECFLRSIIREQLHPFSLVDPLFDFFIHVPLDENDRQNSTSDKNEDQRADENFRMQWPVE